MAWSERPHLELKFGSIEIGEITRLDSFFVFCFLIFFFVFFSWHAAPRVLCNFPLAIARCANAYLRCMSLLLARQSKINHVKIRFSKVTKPAVGLFGRYFVWAAFTVTLLYDRVCVCQSVGSATRTVLAWATTIHTPTWPRRRARTARRSRHHPLLASLRSRRVSHSLVLRERQRERERERERKEGWLHAM